MKKNRAEKRRHGGSRRALSPASREAVQYTVRNIPPHADRALRRKAAEEEKSLNEVLRQAILKEAGEGGGQQAIHHDLDDLVGTWEEDPAFDAAVAEGHRIDETLWR